MSLNYYIKEEDNKKKETINNYKDLFSNYEKNEPSLKEALIQIFKSVISDDTKINKLEEDIRDKCKKFIEPRFNTIKQKYKNISIDDAYIICSYTCESFEGNYSPYKLLNQNLVSDNRKQGIENISKYLFILIKSLRKLDIYYPSQTKKYLYRCISDKVALEKDPFNDKLIPYVSGNQKTFWGFTSTSHNPKTTIDFLGTNQQFKTGTIFTFTGEVWGYDITLFNICREEEILLEPETKFIVDDVFPPVNEIIHITCKIIKSPLVLDFNGMQSTKIINNNNINNQININNCIVKIEGEMEILDSLYYIKGIGYLCNIAAKNIKALITYNKMINLSYLNSLKKLIIIINNEEIEIDMKKSRYKYTNEELDITIIEIIREDNINTFLEIDRFIDSRNYINENIEAIFFKNNNLIDKKKGKIIKRNNNNYICNIDSITNGIIILNDNSKLIGIIKENEFDEIEFIPMNIIINNINYIKCIYEITKDDLGKIILILSDELVCGDSNEEILKKLIVISNKEIFSYDFTYKFNKEGLYIFYFTSNHLITNMSYMFCNCSSLKEIDLSSFNTNQVTDMSSMFEGCSSLEKLNLSSFNTKQVTNMEKMFSGCKSLKEINLSSFNTNQVINMSHMFYECSSLIDINLLSFNTNQVANMSFMFAFCKSLNEINLSSFNINQVTDMSFMFSNCSSLEKLNLSSFNTKQVTNMSWVFLGCKSLKEINLSSFNTNQVTTMHCLFSNCSSLKEIDLSSFNTNQVTDMSSMFKGCSSLEKLNLSSFNTNQVTDMKYMFDGCSSLKELNSCDKKIIKQFKEDNKSCCII